MFLDSYGLKGGPVGTPKSTPKTDQGVCQVGSVLEYKIEPPKFNMEPEK